MNQINDFLSVAFAVDRVPSPRAELEKPDCVGQAPGLLTGFSTRRFGNSGNFFGVDARLADHDFKGNQRDAGSIVDLTNLNVV